MTSFLRPLFFMRSILVSILLSTVIPALAAPDSAAIAALKSSDVVRTEAAAQAVAIHALQRDQSPSYSPYAKVLDLTRAHSQWNQISRGEFVWLVSILNAGSSDLSPVPEALVWVRARDGAVVFLNK